MPFKSSAKVTCLGCGYTDLRAFFALLRGEKPKCPDCGSNNIVEGEPQLRCTKCSETTMPRRNRLYSAVQVLTCQVCEGTEFDAEQKVPSGYI